MESRVKTETATKPAKGKRKKGKAGEKLKWAALRIFMPAMRNALKRRKVKIKNRKDVKEVANLFKIHVLQKRKRYEEGFDEYEYVTNLDVKSTFDLTSDFEENFVSPETVGAAAKEGAGIIKMIVDFFKGLVKKKKKKQKLSPDEKQLLNDAEKEAEKPVSKGLMGGNYMIIGVILVLAVLAVLMMRK